MIKKLLLGFAVVAISALAVNAQPCTPNPIYADSLPGVWPKAFPVAYKCSDYNLTIDIKTLADTTVAFGPSSITLDIQALRILSTSGLPAGFVVAEAYNGNVGGFDAWVNGGNAAPWTEVQGCAQVSALASAIQALPNGSNAITVTVDLYAKNHDPASPILSSYTWTSTIGQTASYTFNLQIDDCTGLNELEANKFAVAPNFPNPFTGTTTIPFSTVKEEPITIKVYNTVGMLVSESHFISKAGKNLHIMDASKLTSGMYIFTVNNGKETITRKMTVQN